MDPTDPNCTCWCWENFLLNFGKIVSNWPKSVLFISPVGKMVYWVGNGQV